MFQLLQTLNSIKSHICRVIIFDNNSSDDTNRINVNTFGYSIDLISSNENVGLRNNLIKSYLGIIDNLDYEFVWILSDDDHLDALLLEKIVENIIKKETLLYFVNHSVKSNGIILKKSVLSKQPSSYSNLRDIFRTDGPQFMLLGSIIYRKDIILKYSLRLRRLIMSSKITLPFRFAMFFCDYSLTIINFPELFVNDQTEISWKDESTLVHRKYILIDLFKLFKSKRDISYIIDILKYLIIKMRKKIING